MHEAAECGPLGHPVRTPPVVALGGPSYPLRSHLRRQGLRQPLRICCAEEAQVLVASLWRADGTASRPDWPATRPCPSAATKSTTTFFVACSRVARVGWGSTAVTFPHRAAGLAGATIAAPG